MAMPLSERVSALRRSRTHPDAMTLGEHLGELRRRLVVVVVAFVVLACVSVFFYNWEFSLLRHPYCQIHSASACRFYVTQPLDALGLRVKLAAFGGLVLASPVMLWELWRFITPGLRSTEKRYAVPFVVSSVLLFLVGCTVVYVVLPHTLGWLIGVGGPSIRALLNPNAYLSLVMLLMVLFGLTFEFPVVLVALQLARVVTPAALLRHWRWAVIGITIGSAVFTPSSDPFSMLALAVPLVAFYFASIGVGKLLRR
ncbi:MAG TPA: twin-arginine translocase subunit TatC [Acidimicrobiales bacterium]|nr:twin-arginine translocase subunit TatC [Acidimicrobiales bacterium]